MSAKTKTPAKKATTKTKAKPKAAPARPKAAAKPAAKPTAPKKKVPTARAKTATPAAAPMVAATPKASATPRSHHAVVRKPARAVRVDTHAFMRAPLVEHSFEVGSIVEVFCDHERNNDRVRGWLKGIVVQVDSKMVAVQFRSNVFLTDGWMVPDRILWFPLTSDQIREQGAGAKRGGKREIPDY